MILRRLADGLKRQDWFVVFIELMIVVVGIYIGLQVDDWNKERQEKKQDQLALALTLEEIELMIDATGRDLEWTQQILEDLQVVMQAVAKCEAGQTEQETVTETINSLRDWRLPNFYLAGLGNIVESGTLTRLRDHEFTQKVGALLEQISFFKESSQLQLRELNEAFNTLEQYLVPVPDTDGQAGFLLTAPIANLCHSDEVKRALLQASLAWASYLNAFTNFDENLNSVHGKIEGALE